MLERAVLGRAAKLMGSRLGSIGLGVWNGGGRLVGQGLHHTSLHTPHATCGLKRHLGVFLFAIFFPFPVWHLVFMDLFVFSWSRCGCSEQLQFSLICSVLSPKMLHGISGVSFADVGSVLTKHLFAKYIFLSSIVKP